MVAPCNRRIGACPGRDIPCNQTVAKSPYAFVYLVNGAPQNWQTPYMLF